MIESSAESGAGHDEVEESMMMSVARQNSLKNYLVNVSGLCDSLRSLLEDTELDRIQRESREEQGKGRQHHKDENNKDDPMLYLTYVQEDSKTRLANPVRCGPIHQQLELMASNLKSVAAVLQSNYEEEEERRNRNDSFDDDDENEGECADQLIGWGEQLCPGEGIVLEDKHLIKSAACNGQRGLYVTSTGDVFSIGDNGTGMPTRQGLEDTTTPKVVGELVLERVLLGRRVVFVACGHLHSCALTQGGRLWSWGCGQYGRLGHGDYKDQPVPRLCESLLNWHVRAVACGGAHTVAVVSPSRVFSWGLGRHGRLGLGDPSGKTHATPQLVDVDNHLLTMTDAYRALFGMEAPNPVQSARDEPVVSVACGWAFTLLLGANGTVRAFGAGKDGQCGVTPANDKFSPTVVQHLCGKGIVQISCGYHHAIAVSEDGAVYTWGMGEEGQLGQGSGCRMSRVPNRVKCPEGFVAKFAVAGQFHSLCVSGTGTLWGWGSNFHGAVHHQLENRKLLWNPAKVEPLIKLNKKKRPRDVQIVKHVAAGAHFTIAVLGPRPTANNYYGNKRSSFRNKNPTFLDSPTSPCWTIPEYEHIRPKLERRAAAALIPQISTGSFCGGRIRFWKNGFFIPRIGVLTSTGSLELYKELNANMPESVIAIHGHDVEIQCKDDILEAWRTRPGHEYSLLLRVQLNSKIEAITWAQHISRHASTEQHVYLGLRNNAPNGRNSLVKGRRAAWRAAIGNALRVTPELYMIYKERATRQEGIGLDVKRTLPTLLLFGKRGEPLYDQLREVLEVYQCYRPDVGYVQGMSYVAAMLCLHMPNDSYECFSCLANLLASQHLFDFFRLGLAYGRVLQYYEVIDLILAKSSPKLWRKLNQLGVLDEIHVTCFQWLQTMFVRRLPLEQVTQLWDAFLCRRDTMVMMRACVALLLCMEKSILAVSQPEDILLLLRTRHRLDEMIKKTFAVVQVPHLAQEKLKLLTEPAI